MNWRKQAQVGKSHIKMSLHSFPFSKSGPESPVIRWFLDKKMVITAFRKVPQKQQQMQILQTLSYVYVMQILFICVCI